MENPGVMTADGFVVWASALEAGYLSVADVEQWADEQIMAQDRPPGWLLDLSLTSSPETAANRLWSGWKQQVEANGCRSRLHERSGELSLGFLFLRYERGDLGMADLLNMAGQNSDVTKCGIGCEAFYLLLNEIDGGGPVLPSDRPLADRVQERFAPFAHLARSYTPLLPLLPGPGRPAG
jgi:hypothetical protein